MAVLTRADKGTALTHAEMDNNLVELQYSPDGKVFDKAQNQGIKLDTTTPDFGWHDLHGVAHADPSGLNAPSFADYELNFREFQFDVDDLMVVRFHIPHDYVMGSDLYIHVHWSHNSTVVTGGTTTWAFNTIYAKGHNQAAFGTSRTTSLIADASLTTRQHLVSETSLTVSGGSASQFDSLDMEPDGAILMNFYLDSNDITTSDASVVKPFVHFLDIHYQSTGIATKNREPDFWT